MAHIFQHKETGLLYTVEHFISDLKFADGGARTGIYAIPYKHTAPIIKYTRQMYRDGKIDEFKPEEFVKEKFVIHSEIY